MHDDDVDPALTRRFEAVARAIALAVATLGLAVLIGWVVGSATLKSVLPGLATMKVNTALCFLLLGTALFAAGRAPGSAGWRWVQRGLALAVGLIGLLSLGEHVSGVDLQIDQLLFADDGLSGHNPPGRMAHATAVGFLLGGLALAMLDSARWQLAAALAASLGLFIGLLALLGYAYGVGALYGVGAYSTVALHTAAGLVFVNGGILLARPGRGLLLLLTSQGSGGVMVRRLLPIALVAPFVIGWLRIAGEHRGYFSSEIGVALVALTYVLLFTGFIWRTAAVLHSSDQSREMLVRAQRRQQAQLAGIINSAMDAIVTVDQAQHVVMFNPAAEQMFGHRAADLLGGPLDALLPERFRAHHVGLMRSFGRTGQTNRRMGGLGSVSGLRADGTEFPIEASISQLDLDDEKYYTIILRDITTRREAELALQAAKLDAERANNAKSRFLAAASHDLRQPLSAMTLYVSALKGHLTPAGQPLLANMRACVDSLSALLVDLLDLSKLDAGVVVPEISEFPVTQLLNNVVSVHGPEARLKGLRLRMVPADLTGRTDPVLFRRVLGNLVSNAVRYTQRGGVLLACRWRAGKTWVEVWDSGIGIPPDKTAEIFEEFKQLGDDARTVGSGLGLAIVAKTAALLGLAIRVQSRPGHGSMFAVELPLGRNATQLPSTQREPVHQPLHIAVVDDNSTVRMALAMALEDAGHQVVAVATGQDLQNQLGGVAPDIVVADFRLARGETGFDVVTALRVRFAADLPAIVITGDSDPQLISSMAERGVVVLHKPVDLAILQVYLRDLTRPDRASERAAAV